MSDVDFWLLPEGLEQQADVIDEWSTQVAELNAALVPIVLQTDSEAQLYNYAIGQMSAMHTGLLQWNAHLQNVFSGISAELRAVAAEGREIDLYGAARVDRITPSEFNGFEAPTDRPYRPGETLAPPAERRDEPDAPTYSPMAPNMAFYLDAGPGAFDGYDSWAKRLFPEDLMSPTGWIRTVMEHIGAVSYREQILRSFGGPWSTLWWYAHKLHGITSFLRDLHSSLTPTFGAISVYWQGYSANSAQAYFARVLSSIAEAADSADSAGDEVTQFAEAIKSTADTLGGEVEGFLNMVISAAGGAAFAAATKETIVGALFGSGVFAVAITRATALWSEIKSIIETTQSLKSTLDTVAGLGSDLGDFTSKLSVPTMQETGS